MSNSSLVSYTKISPFKNSPRNHAIDTITIHCYVGQASVESAGSWFSNPQAKCSCNYMIGTDGRIALIVDEKDRSWCSSSSENDNRAITIECASDAKDPYAVNSKVYASLLNLVTDICKRNGIKELKWKADKSLIGQTDKQNMTVHRWFANKACPGNYLYNLHGEIAAEVNKRLAAAPSGTNAATVKTVTEAEAEKTIWNFLKAKGLNDFAIAGIMGNFYAESGLNPINLQNTYEKKFGMTDAEYTAAVDSGSYNNFSSDSAGYGLVQWTFSTRKKALLDFAKSAKKSIGDLNMQLDFFWKEVQGYSAVIFTLKSAASVLAASNAILTGYEKPADQGTSVQKKRAEYGQKYYDKYATKTAAPAKKNTSFPAVPFTVTVIIDDLNYRASGSNSGAIKGQTGKGVFTITEVKNGWGKLKSGAGWIYLENAEYVTIGKTVASGAAASFSPYMVKVTIKDLNIRAGAGTNTKVVGTCPPGTYTIVKESSGQDAKKWGKLKSGAGWISLDYASKV